MTQPNQMIFTDGEIYQCAVTTAPGTTPVNAPASWRRIQIPKNWRWMLARLSQAYLLEIDGQTDKAAAKRAEALETERTGLDDIIRLAANQEQNRQRPNVQTPPSRRGTF